MTRKIVGNVPVPGLVFRLTYWEQKDTPKEEAMKRATFYSRWALLVLVGAAALTLVACDNDVNFNPIAPAFPRLPTSPDPTPMGPGRNLEIFGTLTAERGSCREATVLYDGRELAGARTVCPKVTGCAKLELSAVVNSTAGHHTISFQVLSQSSDPVDYLAKGRVRVSQEGLAMVTTIRLDPTRATLRPGESVNFGVDFLNFVN
jgi:hypothetical protein